VKFLFAHNNFPAQFRNLASALVMDPRHVVKAIGASGAPGLAGVAMDRYRAPEGPIGQAHPFARHFETECRRAEQVMFAASALSASGFEPDVVFAHCGWGENLPLRAVFPQARIAIYSEFYFRAHGQDVHFDPEAPRLGADAIVTLHCRNAATLLALADADLGVSPTHWQRSTYPKEFHAKIKVAHEGIDVEAASPNDHATVLTPSGRTLRKSDEVITYVSRSLERPRGYHIFMRSLPAVMKARPQAQVVIVGDDRASYGPASPPGATWKEIFLKENAARLDLSRIHFMGRVPRHVYLSVLQISSVHVYLTYPFVLSWSLLEAMSVGCRIVASDTPSVKEVINDDNGVLVPFFDVDRLGAAIIGVLERPRDFAEIGAQARQAAMLRFDKRICVPRLMRLLQIDAS
jgi:glycosyltransferase involved in cell wall biosynthesis